MNEDEKAESNAKRDTAKNAALHSLGYRANGQDPETGALPGGIGADYGKVKIWNLAEKKYVEMWPVDAAEAIAGGGATLDKPGNEPEAE